jgi:hypothetical protein
MRHTVCTHHFVALATAAILAGCLVTANAATAAGSDSGLRSGLPAVPGCAHPARNAEACLVVARFFDHVDHGHYPAACDLLGARLRYESGGPRCAKAMAWAYFAGNRSWSILGTRPTEVDVGVLVRLRLPELGHTRRVTWLARVAREPGSRGPRIVSTRLVW